MSTELNRIAFVHHDTLVEAEILTLQSASLSKLVIALKLMFQPAKLQAEFSFCLFCFQSPHLPLLQ